MTHPPFHLAIPVFDLEDTRRFYTEILGCRVGRSSERWIDFDFFGHQLTTHLAPSEELAGTNPVDGQDVPVRHFGAILEWDRWHDKADALKQRGVAFRIAPQIRFRGQVGEQATMFFDDPSGNAIELKSFRDPAQIFEHSPPA
ncbi:MAG: VOC family protein [Myxococcota bacterium]